MATDPEFGRRRFLRESVLSVAKTAHEYLKHRDATPDPTAPTPRTDWLRPPGAVQEALFLERCTRCADCVKACPYECVAFHPLDGSPIIFPSTAPCQLCDSFPCIAACETDALLPVPGREGVKMGLAVVSHRDCTAAQGCHACISQCPMNALVMDVASLQVSVTAERCVGCGICQQVCQTVNDTIAVRVTPARMIA
jgi:ferredoxin-type protein NapG